MEFDSRTFAVIFMIAAFLIIVGVDVYLAFNKKKGDTFSEILRGAGRKWMPLIMLVTFGMGLLAGHWWW